MNLAFQAPARARWVRAAAAVALVGVLSACSTGALWGGGSESSAAAQSQLANASASQSEINQAAMAALPAIATECPPIQVRPGGEAMFSYQNNKASDPRALRYQAVIDQKSRNCVVSNGLITVRMGVVGRFLTGPAGSAGEYTVPVRFAVQRDGMAVFSERYDLPVTVTAADQSNEFIKVVEDVQIPYIGGEDITIWVGFDPA